MKQGWEIKKLGDVCELISRGISPKYTEKNGLVVLNQKCVRDHKISFKQSRLHNREEKKVGLEKFIKQGDVLVNSTGTGTLGRVAQVKDKIEDVTVDSHVTIVRPLSDLFFNDFFGWVMIFIEDEISTRGAGCGGQTELARETLKNDFTISYPKSIKEQQRIVSILDEAFANISKVKDNAEQNLKNAKELFENYLQNIFINKGKDWKEKTLGDVCTLYQGIAINAKTKHSLVEKSSLPLLRIKDLKNNTVEQYIDPNNYPVNALVKEEDIIYTRTGSLGLVFRGKKGVLHNNSFKVVPSPELINDYLFIWLQNPLFKSKIMSLALKAAQPDITHAIFKVQEIAIPPIKEQKEIVKKLETLSIETKRLEAIYEQKINGLEELKKSILQKAFNGEL